MQILNEFRLSVDIGNAARSLEASFGQIKSDVLLEDPDAREFAAIDPCSFLARYPDNAILDEIQRSPKLFSYLQTRADIDGRMGLYILTCSQQFGLLSGITQSLAGRVGMVQLLPSLPEPPQLQQAVSEDPEALFLRYRAGGVAFRCAKRRTARHSSARGALFETWVVGELLKGRYNKSLPSNLFFWRDNTGNEVDILADKGRPSSP